MTSAARLRIQTITNDVSLPLPMPLPVPASPPPPLNHQSAITSSKLNPSAPPTAISPSPQNLVNPLVPLSHNIVTTTFPFPSQPLSRTALTLAHTFTALLLPMKIPSRSTSHRAMRLAWASVTRTAEVMWDRPAERLAVRRLIPMPSIIVSVWWRRRVPIGEGC